MEKNLDSREKRLAKILSIVKKNPGIRPSKLNKLLHLEHSSNLRNTLIKRGLIRKERRGIVVRYYLVS